MEAVIITVGKELLMGQTINSNLATIARRLSQAGLKVTQSIVIDDRKQDYFDVLDRCKGDVIVFTGGLGPTEDDLTKEAVFDYFDIETSLNQTVLDTIKGYFKRMNIPMSSANLKQAMLPKDGVVLNNPNGTAPGVYYHLKDRHIILLPGPPHEMTPMLEQACSVLEKEMDYHIHSSGYKLVGIGESTLEEGMKDIYSMDPDVLVAPYASVGELKYIFSSKNKQSLKKVSQYFEEKYRPYIYGTLKDTLESVVVGLLKESGLTISMAESCTGGLLASRIVNVSGASDVFKESFVTYSNEAKKRHLGVSEETLQKAGAVSEQCAKEMALGLHEKTQCDVCVSITGIAGPTGGTIDKPVGLVHFGIWINGGVISDHRIFNGNREMVRYRASQHALNLIRKGLIQ